MKNIKFFFSLIAFSTLFFLVSCGGKPKLAPTGLEKTGVYICPMYCTGSGSEKPGKCPACKMDYVANPNKDMDKGHDHDAHEGHDHGDHDGHGHNHDHGDHDGHEH